MDQEAMSWAVHLFSIYFWYLTAKVWMYNNQGPDFDGYAMLPASVSIVGFLSTFYTISAFAKTIWSTYGSSF